MKTFCNSLLIKQQKLHIAAMLLIVLLFSTQTHAQGGIYDSVTFETPTSEIIIDSSLNNIWQIGTPDKSFFNDAHTGIKAMVTDTIDSYSPNDTSVFIYVIRNPYTETCYTYMHFWHKYDMDTLTDKGIIEASYDGGTSWMVVNDTSGMPFMDSYFSWDWDFHASSGTYTPHPVTTTGKSDGWILSGFNWQWWMPVRSDSIIYPLDSLMIRFTFISDSVNTNKEGWMIDDIVTYGAGWANCSGIRDLTAKKRLTVFPNPFSVQTTLKTNFELNRANIVILDSFGRKIKQMKNVSGQTITFNRNGLPSGIYFLFVTEKSKLLATGKMIVVE